MEGERFQDDMLRKYGCATIEAVAGRRRPAGVLVVVLNDGVLLSPDFFASLLVNWFGGFANGYAVKSCQLGCFYFLVAHACIAKEIVLHDCWTSGLLRVRMTLSSLSPSAPPLSLPRVRSSAWVANAALPSLMGPHPMHDARAQVSGVSATAWQISALSPQHAGSHNQPPGGLDLPNPPPVLTQQAPGL